MTNKKKVQAVSQKVQKNNTAFESMKPAERRVVIAQDVIAQLKSKKLFARTGSYVKSSTDWADPDIIPGLIAGEKEDKELAALLKKVPTCEVCVRGAFFVCAVKRFNNLSCGEVAKQYETVRQHFDQPTIEFIEKRFFTKAQIGLIEEAFEDGDNNRSRSDLLSNKQSDRAREFYEAFDNPEDRMIAIMKNIIANKGTFKPEQTLKELFRPVQD